ncbi:MAG: lipid-A-disaccharide synthase [Gammaproteobacteria bacterium]|nr:lipid-A-disaccharide synthase [Gammaproteobacteria bacterium]
MLTGSRVRPLRIAVVAGEASGDRLGAGLIRALVVGPRAVEIAGVAGPEMREAGCRPLMDASGFAVMGLAEILSHLPRLWMLRRRLLGQLAAFRPDVFVGIDSPELNLGLAARMKKLGVPTVQYVCPSIWAWRAGRARRIRRCCDSVLCLLPFELPLLREQGIPGEFVGHPLADAARNGSRREGNRGNSLLVALLPGSRRSEILRIGPSIAQAAAWLAARRSSARFAFAAATGLGAVQFSAILKRFAPDIEVRTWSGSARALLAKADLALAASGTVTMEAMLSGCPLVVAYRVAPLTAWIARAFRLVKTPWISLPNILAGSGIVPELLQGRACGELLGAELLRLHDDPQARRSMRAEFARLSALLGRGASARAAKAVLAAARAF